MNSDGVPSFNDEFNSLDLDQEDESVEKKDDLEPGLREKPYALTRKPSLKTSSEDHRTFDKENRMLKLKNTKVNLMNPFFDKNFQNFYLKQMMLKNINRVYFSTIALLLSILVSSLTNFIIEGDSSNSLWAARVIEIFCVLALCLFLALYNAEIVMESPFFSKIYLGFVIAFSILSRLIEIYFLHAENVTSLT